MILDAQELSDGQTITADICIVGAGAAGISMALELIASGYRVLLLESGGFEEENQTQALYAGSVTDEKMHSPPDRYRQRRFGGSTTIWGGRCVPLDPIDFERRDYVPDSGWPIDLSALLPFYPRANKLCEAGDFAYTIAQSFKTPPPSIIAGFTSPHFSTDTIERVSCPTDFGARYRHKLQASSDVQVLLHANLTELRLDENGTIVDTAIVRTLTGKQLTVSARHFALAMGGLEIPRILLANRSVHANGIGNDNDVVGRYYMCHLSGSVGVLKVNGPRSVVWHDYDVSDEGVYCRRRLALTADAQRRLRIGNFIARLHHPHVTDPAHNTGILSLLYMAKPFIPYEYGRRFQGEKGMTVSSWMRHARNVVTDPVYTAEFLSHWLRKRTLATRKYPSVVVKPRVNRFSLEFHSEQIPSINSRISLTGDLDALGTPKIHIDWRYSEADIAIVRSALDLFAEDVRSCGVGEYTYDSASLESEVMRYGAYGGHHMGTARMGSNPRTSVVDANGCVHGMSNLFLTGSAVFPTSSQANPTLTIVALALRTADYLRTRMMQDRSTELRARDTEDKLPA